MRIRVPFFTYFVNLSLIFIGNGQKNGPEVKKPILRPIICICNDHNAASLAKLRPYAYQIRMSRPADIHTVKRLRTICDAEGLKAETRALGTLVGIARGDLRSCLNTLQVCLATVLFLSTPLNNSLLVHQVP